MVQGAAALQLKRHLAFSLVLRVPQVEGTIFLLSLELWENGRERYFGEIGSNQKKKKAKILKIPAESLCSFPIWFPSVFQMSFFFHDRGHFITPGRVKDTKYSPLQPRWPHARPVLKHSYWGIKKGPRVVFTQPRIFI